MICRVILLAWISSVSLLAGESLTLDAILEHCVKASSSPQVHEQKRAFAFRRSSEVTYLDSEGKARNQVTRVYEVKPLDGEIQTKLLTINGKPPTEAEVQKTSKIRDTGEQSRKLEVNQDLIARYTFTLGESQTLNGRPVFTIYFSPRPDAPSDALFDKLINAMFGALYIDQEDFQILKADAHLSEKISFFGGLVGAIEQLDLSIVQRRLEPGIWLPELTLINFSGRKLFSDLKFRCAEKYADYQRVLEDKAINGVAGPK